MKKLRGLGLMMLVAIFAITGFQGYWLKENYDREKKSLSIKTDASFRQTIQHLQVVKLKLDNLPPDLRGKGNVKLIMRENGHHYLPDTSRSKLEFISTINVIRAKMNDSLRRFPPKGPDDFPNGNKMVISLNDTTLTYNRDSVKRFKGLPGALRDHIFQVLYGVDSLQDSLKIKEISDAYGQSLQKQQLDIPFDVSRIDSIPPGVESDFNRVTVGFAHPITYQLQLGNTVPYLLRRITLPILFSALLLGITILSFLLLYRTLRRQRRVAELKNEFISNITHELKTPIATVGVAIEALKNFNAIEDPQRTREYLDISSNELQRLSLLVDKVLKLSMFEKKEIELQYENFDLHDVVNEVLTSLRLQLEKYNASVTVHAEGNLYMQGDRLHMQSVVFNLLDNAIKYSKGNPVVQIGLQQDDNNIIMSMQDNGIGIPQEYNSKVFEKFFRVPHGDTHNAKGYGLGLSYVAHVVQQHHGTIRLESEAGTGSLFTIVLPKKST